MENPKNELATKLKDANNVLVTVSTNPTVDQLSAAIGITLFLTKLKKHATTVFSGQIPSIIDFLKPEETIETNTDSLRDFIISLDKAKADKIRYKVEDTMVKIFITPYRTSITDQDLVFSQGDFNVDVVVALGIQNREDIDQAIMAHGRILHDATVATINLSEGSDIGTLNWTDPHSSSLCEMMVSLTDLLKTNSLDGQMATAFLTGIVAETERFSNEKTSSNTMNASAKLMTAGANQQLVATKLQPPEDDQPSSTGNPSDPDGSDDADKPKDASMDDDGSLRINHKSSIPETDEPQTTMPPTDSLPAPWSPNSPAQTVAPGSIDDAPQNELDVRQENRPMLSTPPNQPQDDGLFGFPGSEPEPGSSRNDSPDSSWMAQQPPRFGGQLNATDNAGNDPVNPFSMSSTSSPMLSHKSDKPQQEPPKPEDSGPPEPYTVFEPEPWTPEPAETSDKFSPDSSPTPTANLPKAVESVGLSLPPPPPMSPAPKPQTPEPAKPITNAPTGQPFVDMGGKTLSDIEEKVESPHLKEGTAKLPEPFVRSLDATTLAGLEEKVESPHLKEAPKTPADNTAVDDIDFKKEAAKQVAKVMSDTTLDKIEEKVESPHLQQQVEISAAQKPKKEEISALSYEPHESEPAEKPKVVEQVKDEPEGEKKPVVLAQTTEKKEEPLKLPVTPPKVTEKESQKLPEKKPDTTTTTVPKTGEAQQDEARNAVLRAINTGGDGRTSLPPKASIGTSGAVEVAHEEAKQPEAQEETAPPPVPPPLPAAPKHSGPSPNISIDPKDGTLTPLPPNLVPNSDELPVDETAAGGEASAPPPVPPPMMPSTPANAQNH